MAAIILLGLVLLALALRQNIIVILLGAAAYTHLVWGDGRLEYLAEDIWISLDSGLLLAKLSRFKFFATLQTGKYSLRQ